MGRIHFMEFQNKYEIDNIKQISVDNSKDLLNYITMINDGISKADIVFIYRSHNHIMDKNKLIEWVQMNCNRYEKEIELIVKSHDRKLVISSADKSDILVLNMNDCIRKEFNDRFYIYYGDFRYCITDEMYKNEMLTEDPRYDQYDFVFVKEGKVMMWTSMHELMIFANVMDKR